MKRIIVFRQPASKYLVTEMACWAAGGPLKYTCRSIGRLSPASYDHEEERNAFRDDAHQGAAPLALDCHEPLLPHDPAI
jgi:hypothetical protein